MTQEITIRTTKSGKRDQLDVRAMIIAEFKFLWEVSQGKRKWNAQRNYDKEGIRFFVPDPGQRPYATDYERRINYQMMSNGRLGTVTF